MGGRADTVELKRLLDLEPERLESVELTAEEACTDRLCQKAAYRILTPEREIPEIPVGVRRWKWHVWGQRPCSFREIEYRGPFPDLDEVFTFDRGASSDLNWLAMKPDAATGWRLERSGARSGPCEGFIWQLPPPMMDVLETDLWDILDGAEATYSLTATDEEILGRPAVLLDVNYEEVEANLWGDLFLPAERHTVWVDKETSIILKVGCWFEGQEFSVMEVTSLSLDPIDPSIFRPPAL